jgi:hypothetical protein
LQARGLQIVLSMHFRGYRVLLFVFAATLATAAPLSAQTLTTYDDFSSEQIDPERWTGSQRAIRYGSVEGGWINEAEGQWQHHPEFSIVNTTADRRIVGGQLRLQLRTSGGSHDNTMAPGHGRLSLRAKTFDVTRVQTRVTIMGAEAQPCRSTGDSRTRAQAHLELSRGTLNQTLLFATLSLQRSGFGGDRIVAVLSRCRAPDCTVAEDLDAVVFDRSWTLRTAHTLTITHQPAIDRVVFSVSGGGVAAESRTLRYSPPTEERYLSGMFFLRVENSPSNCPADGASPSERVAVTIDARFDNVRTSEVAP